MSLVLLVDDDRSTLDTFTAALRLAHHAVLTAETGREGLAVALQRTPNVVVSDLNLPDLSGLDLLRSLRERQSEIPFVIVTGFGSTRAAVEAMHLGAHDFLEKPLDFDDLIRTVQEATSNRHDASGLDDPANHAAKRWAMAVVHAVDSPFDPRTLRLWGRHIGSSSGTIRNWCRTANLSSKRSIDFARMLRAVVRARQRNASLENLLDVVDKRTIAKLLRLGRERHPDAADMRLPTTAGEYLALQQWIRNASALAEVAAALRVSNFM